MTLSEELSTFVVDLDYESLPKDVIEKAKLCTLDLVGVALFGSNMPWAKSVYETFRDFGGKMESTVLRYGDRIPCPNAAMVNGTMAHSYELDDNDGYDITHPGGIIIPTALATAEREEADGKQFITSVVAGYEILVRLLDAISPIPKRLFSRESMMGPFSSKVFGSVTTAGKILGLNRKQFANAFGVASSFSSGLLGDSTMDLSYSSSGPWTKRIHPGKSCYNGVLCTLLAEKGFIGPLTIFEGAKGLLRVYCDEPDLKAVTDGLGSKWLIRETTFKSYPVCSRIHPPIKATLQLIKSHRIGPRDVEKIVVYVGSRLYGSAEPHEKKIAPETIIAAQFSIPYAVAVAISRGGVTVDDISLERIQDLEIKSLASRVKTVIDPVFDRPESWRNIQARVEITTRDGRRYSEEVDSAKAFLFTREELIGKFRSLTAGILTKEKIELVINKILRLETLSNIEELTNLLA